jgi:hypothetical protein
MVALPGLFFDSKPWVMVFGNYFSDSQNGPDRPEPEGNGFKELQEVVAECQYLFVGGWAWLWC